MYTQNETFAQLSGAVDEKNSNLTKQLAQLNSSLVNHKSSTDHDNRYYAKAEVDTRINSTMQTCDVLLDYTSLYLNTTLSYNSLTLNKPYKNYKILIFEAWTVSDMANRVFAELSTAAFLQGVLPILHAPSFNIAFYAGSSITYNLAGANVHCRIFGVK